MFAVTPFLLVKVYRIKINSKKLKVQFTADYTWKVAVEFRPATASPKVDCRYREQYQSSRGRLSIRLRCTESPMAIPRSIPKWPRSKLNQSSVHRVIDGDTARNTKVVAVDFQSDYGAPSLRWRYRDEYQSSRGRLSIRLRCTESPMAIPRRIPKQPRSTFNQTTEHRVFDGDTAINTKVVAVNSQSNFGQPSQLRFFFFSVTFLFRQIRSTTISYRPTRPPLPEFVTDKTKTSTF
jgi:cyclophilin family peptidyl-prolyl cis-trans isomerase